MSKATQQSAERCQDKRSSQKPAARRPAAQMQIRVYGLPAHFARSGRDGPPTLILCGLVYARENIGRSQDAPRSSGHGANFIPQPSFLPTASVRSAPFGRANQKRHGNPYPAINPKLFYEGAKKYAPVRSFSLDDPAMTNDPKALQAVLRKISQNSERSSLFWWMVENHRRLKAEAQGRRLRWEPLCISFNEYGLTDINGQPPKPNTARQTWLRARRFVAEQEKRSAAAKRPWSTYPSHFPKNFRPAGSPLPEQGVPAPAPNAAPPDTRVGTQSGRPAPAAADPNAGADTLRDALSALDKTDGYLKSP